MKTGSIKSRVVALFLLVIILLSSVSSTMAGSVPTGSMKENPVDAPVVVRVYFDTTQDLNQLAANLDVWEVDHAAGYLVAMVSPEQYASLMQAGYQVVIDQDKTNMLSQRNIPLPGQIEGIPGFPCYRTVGETYASMQDLTTNHPDLVTLIDIGDSWDKVTVGDPSGYDLYALQVTHESSGPIADKPTFFLMAEIHARELVTSETAMRYAEYLVSNYGIDPDITWLLDYFRVYIVPMTNPDGRIFAETGEWWRKNTDNDDGCTSFPDYGTDLNRNHSFHWGGAGTNPCGETYQGPSAASEPETQAIQNFVLTLFEDQRGPGDTDPAPPETTGTFISLHSYSQLILWPWGYTYTQAPNHTQLQTLGRHMAYFNNYYPEQAIGLYPTTGTSDDWSYGTLGIASYTFEMGTSFFQGCSTFENTIYPDNLDALLYAIKTARRPYQNPAGPDILNVAVLPDSVPAGTSVLLSATANDTRFNNSNGTEPTQNISAAHFSIDAPAWITDTITFPMSASDGAFDEKTEGIQATVDTSTLLPGRHTIFVESQDVAGNWGVTSAVFLEVTGTIVAPEADFSSNTPVQLGETMVFTNTTTGQGSLSYLWDFGDGSDTSTEFSPTHVYTSTGTFTVTLEATNAGGSDEISHPVSVEPAAIHTVDLTLVTTGTIQIGDMAKFIVEILPDQADKPYTYTVDFGDGSVITDTSSLDPLPLEHVYNWGSTFTVQVLLWNNVMVDPVGDTLDVLVEPYRLFLPVSVK